MDKTSKFISLILRHKPDVIGISLDKYGWANVGDVIAGISQKGYKIDMGLLEKIVCTDSKQRYSFNENKTMIRANQGHSIKVNLELEEVKPPEVLYHGTADRFLDSIFTKGLIKGNRQYVHLSSDEKTSYTVGKRHGKSVILEIMSGDMYRRGYKFYISDNGVWLTDEVPVEFIRGNRDVKM